MEEKKNRFGTVGGMFKGILHPSVYIETGKRSTWLSVHVLILVVCILLPCLVFYIPISRRIGNDRLANEIDDRIAYFSLGEDGFYCEKKYELKRQGSTYIKINTSEYDTESDEIDELLEEGHYQTMVIVTNQEILLYSDDSPTRIRWSSVYEHLQSIESNRTYDKDSLLELTRKYDTPVLIGVTVLFMILFLVSYYIAGLLWGIIGNILKRIFGLSDEVDFSEMMKAAILIRTPWLVIFTLGLRRHFRIACMLCAVVIFVYLIAAIKLYAKKILYIPDSAEEGKTETMHDDYDGD